MPIRNPDQQIINLLNTPKTKKELATKTGKGLKVIEAHLTFLTVNPSPENSYVVIAEDGSGPRPSLYQERKAFEKYQEVSNISASQHPDSPNLNPEISEARELKVQLEREYAEAHCIRYHNPVSGKSYPFLEQIVRKGFPLKTLYAILYYYTFDRMGNPLEDRIFTEKNLKESISNIQAMLRAFIETLEEVKDSAIWTKSQLGKNQLGGEVSPKLLREGIEPLAEKWFEEKVAKLKELGLLELED